MVKYSLQNLPKYEPVRRLDEMVEAYCVKCREKREIKNPKETKLKNGRAAVKGSCSVCGTNVFRIGKLA